MAHALKPGRFGWLQVLRGAVTLNDEPLSTSDGAAVSDETGLEIHSDGGAEVMLFDLP